MLLTKHRPVGLQHSAPHPQIGAAIQPCAGHTPCARSAEPAGLAAPPPPVPVGHTVSKGSSRYGRATVTVTSARLACGAPCKRADGRTAACWAGRQPGGQPGRQRQAGRQMGGQAAWQAGRQAEGSLPSRSPGRPSKMQLATRTYVWLTVVAQNPDNSCPGNKWTRMGNRRRAGKQA